MAVFALIPAAGKSTRMGCSKLSLPVGKRTVLDCVIAALKGADIAEILVVLAPHTAHLEDIAITAGARVLKLPAETADMRATIECGLSWLETTFHPTANDAWLLVPADHPTLDAAIVREMLARRCETTYQSIFVPTFAGKRGHPTLIGWQHCDALRELPHGQGLNTYLRAQSVNVLEVPVTSPEVLQDLDTPEDYDRLLARRSD